MKYKAQRVEYAGRSFASKLERETYTLLSIMQSKGLIRDLRCQVQVLLTKAQIIYKPDFQFFDCEKQIPAWGESKGFETDVWRLKKKLWAYFGPGPLWLFKASKNGPYITEIIVPKQDDA